MKLERDILVEDKGSIEELIWAPDGRQLAVVKFAPRSGVREGMGEAGSVLVYEAATWRVDWTAPTGVARPVSRVCWARDASHLAIASPEAVTIWHVATAQLVARLAPSEGEIFSVACSPDRHLLAASRMVGEDVSVVIWEVETAEERYRLSFKAPSAGVSWMAWSPREASLATLTLEHTGLGTFKRQVLVWNVPTGTVRRQLPLPPGPFEGLGQSHGWSPDGRALAVATGAGLDDLTGAFSEKAQLTIWDLENDKVRSTFRVPDRSLIGAAWSPDGRQLASSTSKEILVFDAKTGAVERFPSLFPEEPPESEKLRVGERVSFMTSLGFTRSLAWSPDGRALVAGNVGGIRIWSVDRS